MRIEFHYKEYTCCTYKVLLYMLTLYIHACIHICTYILYTRRGSAAYPIPVSDRGRSTFYCLLQTLSPKGSRWVQLHTVSRWSWPGRSSAWGLSQPCRQSGEKKLNCELPTWWIRGFHKVSWVVAGFSAAELLRLKLHYKCLFFLSKCDRHFYILSPPQIRILSP